MSHSMQGAADSRQQANERGTTTRSSKLPAIQFYPGDWRKDLGVQSLGYFDRGVWFELLCLMHESEDRGKLLLNGAPMPDDAIGRVLGLDKQILTTTLAKLVTAGVASRDEQTGALMCRRMVRDENLRKVRTDAGKRGGNPALLNQKPTTGVKQIPTPSSSTSSSISSSDVSTFAQSVPPEELAGTLPLIDGTDYEISKEKVSQWSQAFPAVDVRQALLHFKAWLGANPRKRKTRAGIERSIVFWLGREQDKGGNNAAGNGRAANTSPTHERVKRNQQAIIEALARRGICDAIATGFADGNSLPDARPVGRDRELSDGLRTIGAPVLTFPR